MQSIQPLLKFWRKWFNRNKLFKIDEMNELESHLLDEIDYIKEHDKLSEEQAFHKAVELFGQREKLDHEYNKNHGLSFPKLFFWIRGFSLQLFIASLLVIIFLIGDFRFSQKYTLNITCKEIENVLDMEPILSMDQNNTFKISFRMYYERKSQTIHWNVNQENSKIESMPMFFAPIRIYGNDYLLVLDNQKQLWMGDADIFTPDSRRYKLVTNTDWSYWKNYLRDETLRQKIPISPINTVPFNTYGYYNEPSLAKTYRFVSDLYLSDYMDFRFFSLGTDNQVMNTFIYMRSDQTSIHISKIFLFDGIEHNMRGWGSAEVSYNKPLLLIRNSQLERRPLHIFPFLYQKVVGIVKK